MLVRLLAVLSGKSFVTIFFPDLFFMFTSQAHLRYFWLRHNPRHFFFFPSDGHREPGVERGSHDPSGGAPGRQARGDGLQQARDGEVRYMCYKYRVLKPSFYAEKAERAWHVSLPCFGAVAVDVIVS